MDFTIKPRDGLLWVTATGQVSLIEALLMFKKACDHAVEGGLNRILVDCSAVTGVLSDLQRYDLGRIGAENALKKSRVFKIATVGYPPVVDGFAALVAFNRGVTTDTFRDVQEALSWLKRFGTRAAAME